MHCLNQDGTLTEGAIMLLKELERPMSENQIAEEIGQPLYKVIGNLRELVSNGFICISNNRYYLTELGKERIPSTINS